jgi:hypothetical protein
MEPLRLKPFIMRILHAATHQGGIARQLLLRICLAYVAHNCGPFRSHTTASGVTLTAANQSCFLSRRACDLRRVARCATIRVLWHYSGRL